MAKFNTPIDDDVLPAPSVTVIDVNNNQSDSSDTQQSVQAQASVGLAQAAIDDKLVDHGIQKEEEHWVKAYWRPSAGWIYLLICIFDFIIFPLLAMILPIIAKGFNVQYAYTPWTSLTLSNGGMIHMSFGTILGITAWTRGQEKLSRNN